MDKILSFYLAQLSLRIISRTAVASSFQRTSCPNINARGGAQI
jgi:hypothetical protein